jgi:hypothetical protein
VSSVPNTASLAEVLQKDSTSMTKATLIDSERKSIASEYQEAVIINISVSDRSVRHAILGHEDGPQRDQFIQTALRIGVLAIGEAEGQLDIEKLRIEGNRLLGELTHILSEGSRSIDLGLTSTLRDYFDPESGRFSERIKRLLCNDGELEQLLRRYVSDEGSELVRTLTDHLGENSPLLKWLSPENSAGLISNISTSVQSSMAQQNESILRQFSLDNKESALSRLVSELASKYGAASDLLVGKIEDVVSEFSLDQEDSALSRLIRRVEQAQKQISGEFSLDNDGSSLSRMRRELQELIEQQNQRSEKFQNEVLQRLSEMIGRKKELVRSTRRGDVFEDAVFDFLQARSQKAGDLVLQTGRTTGSIKNCKKGDATIQLSQENTAAGARIVIESKEDATYTVSDALEEIEIARKNRTAEVGVFVFSMKTAPNGIEPFARYGDDILIIWDADDPQNDVNLIAAISVAKALCTRKIAARNQQTADFDSIENLVVQLEKQLKSVDEIRRSAETVKSSGEKILDRARILSETSFRLLAELSSRISEVKMTLTPTQ